MKPISVAFLFCLTSTIANAQIVPEFRQFPKTVLCGPVSTILSTLTDQEVNEQPFWIGKDASENSNYALFVNAKTGAFTIIQFTQEIGCVLGVGYKSETYLPKGKPL